MDKKTGIRMSLMKIAIGFMTYGVDAVVNPMPSWLHTFLTFLRIYLLGASFISLIYHVFRKETLV